MGRVEGAALRASGPPPIDLRSDMLAPPTAAMFEALAGAEIGWAIRGEDDTVNRLEEIAASMLGTEAALFLPNATTANFLALLTHGERGDVVLMDRAAHINLVEWYGLALGGLLTRTIPADRGHLDPAEVETVFGDVVGGRAPRIGLLVLENSHTFAGGIAIPAAETARVAGIAHAHGAAVHLDGARLLNAAVALGVPVSALTSSVDTTTLSLNKGLCAPYGGVLAGPADLIDRARVLSHRIGNGRVHRAGYFAAAGIIALETMVDRLGDDNARARRLASALAEIDGLSVDLETVQTNLVLFRLDDRFGDPDVVAERIRGRGVGLLPMPDRHLRAVTHRGIDDDAIEAAIEAIAAELA